MCVYLLCVAYNTKKLNTHQIKEDDPNEPGLPTRSNIIHKSKGRMPSCQILFILEYAW